MNSGALNPIFAILTPFDAQGQVDAAALADYLAFLAERGVRTLLVNGTTAEFYAMTIEERCRVLEAVKSQFSGTLIAHVSATVPADVHRLIEHANDLADAVLLLPSYYLARASDDGMRDFFLQSLRPARKPIYLYNFPRHCGYNIPPSLPVQLKQVGLDIRGVKDSAGQIEPALAYKAADPQLEVYLGSDSRLVRIRQSGLDGTVTGSGNAVPEYLVQINTSLNAGRIEEAETIEAEFDSWNQFRKGLASPQISIAKAVLSVRIPGFPIHVRPPLTAVSDTDLAACATFIDALEKESPLLTSNPRKQS